MSVQFLYHASFDCIEHGSEIKELSHVQKLCGSGLYRTVSFAEQHVIISRRIKIICRNLSLTNTDVYSGSAIL